MVLVLGLHALALWWLLNLGVWRDRMPSPKDIAPLTVQVLRWLPGAAATNKAALKPTPATAAHALAPARAPAADPRAITLPTPSSCESATPEAAAPAPLAAQAAASAASRPLDLRMPLAAAAPWRGHKPALNDPRTTSPRPTVESRIAAALGGSDNITEEPLGDGRVRMHRGTGCVVVHPNRAQVLDPFNGSVFPKPRGVEKC